MKKILYTQKTLGPVSDLERHLPAEWWKTLFNSLYLKTDGDVVENNINTEFEVDLLIGKLDLKKEDNILDLCCGQGRHSLELGMRGFNNVSGIDRSRYLIRLARKRAQKNGLFMRFSEGDARKIRLQSDTHDCVYLMGNSFGYFEQEDDDANVLKSIKRILKSNGKLALDITNGEFLRNNFESRSWEWIDQNQFVCRERSLSADKERIISREVIVHAEKGVITDQFYAERLYDENQIKSLLKKVGFENISVEKDNIIASSTRGHDLGMMANRLFITAKAPEKIIQQKITAKKQEVLVLLGDHTLSDTIKKNGTFNEEDIVTIDKLKDNLSLLPNHNFQYFGNHQNLLKYFQNNSPQFVFNLCDEGFKNDANMELHITAILEMFGIPYSGSGPSTLALCYNKSIVRAIASDLDIAVPQEAYYGDMDQAASLASIFPALLKPNFGDSSIGITTGAVVHNSKEFMSYLDKLKKEFPKTPILIQEFLEGNEYSVGIVGNPGNYQILPILEVDYSNLPKDLPKILGYESKWLPESPYWKNISYKESAIGEEDRRQLIDYSTKLFERTGCRDYARFDFRADKDGVIKLLEVNPNPGWCWDGKLNIMAGFQNTSYKELLEMILRAAKERLGLV
ncbi:methyltransferase domain-containing protein [Rickettsiales bacterium]|nr:methyltransferase domain-containing protein [Rickettsiales bacterium]